MSNDNHVRANFADDFNEYIRLTMYRYNYQIGGAFEVMNTGSFETVPSGTHRVDPDHAFVINKKEAQALMDDLWKCGFRPTEGEGSAGMANAMSTNLVDLRSHIHDINIHNANLYQIIFKLLEEINSLPIVMSSKDLEIPARKANLNDPTLTQG